MLEGEAMKASLKKIVKHERELLLKQKEYDTRIKLERINYKEDFVPAFKRIRETDKRVPLIMCTKEYLSP
jgi:hypothetical protein